MSKRVMESWMYGSPEAIADRLAARSRTRTGDEATRREIERRRTGGRIGTLVKKTKEGK